MDFNVFHKRFLLTIESQAHLSEEETANLLVIGLRNQEKEVREFTYINQLHEIDSETFEFPNGNTFVRLKDEVMGRDTLVMLSESLKSDQLMEALIKIRTLRMNGARQVIVATCASLKDLQVHDGHGANIDVNVRELLIVAGADQIVDREKKRPDNVSRYPQKRITGGSTVVWGASHPHLRDHLARELGARLGSPALLQQIAGTACKQFQAVVVLASTAPVNETFFKGLGEIRRIKRLGVAVHLITPYLLYARSDKIDQPGISITGRLVADLIEYSGADSILFVRAHAPQSQGFFSIPSFHVSGRRTLNQFLANAGIDVIVSPDAGFQKHAALYAQELQLPLATINRARGPVMGCHEASGLSGESVAGRCVAIIDDETSSGATLASAAKILREHGAEKIIAVVTHLAGSAAEALACEEIERIVVTDTLPVEIEHPRLQVLPIAEEIAFCLKSLLPKPAPSMVGVASDADVVVTSGFADLRKTWLEMRVESRYRH